MLRLTNRFAIALFCMVIALFAIAMATMLEYLLYPQEFVTTAPGKNAIIVSATAMPTAWFVAEISAVTSADR